MEEKQTTYTNLNALHLWRVSYRYVSVFCTVGPGGSNEYERGPVHILSAGDSIRSLIEAIWLSLDRGVDMGQIDLKEVVYLGNPDNDTVA